MIFQWVGLPQALWVLREKGTDTNSGAFVARHLGNLPVAAFAARSNKQKLDRWTDFARRWERTNGGEARWRATLAEVRLLVGHCALVATSCSLRLLPVQVIDLIYKLSSRTMSVNCASEIIHTPTYS